MGVFIVEPDAKGRVSGGYRYNHELVHAHPALQLISVDRQDLARRLAAVEVAAGDWLLLDSLFLNAIDWVPFCEARRRTGARLGLLLHALPSFIAKARKDDRAGLLDPRLPPDEAGLLGQLDVVVCPGPYGPRLLEASGVPTRVILCPPGRIDVTTAPPKAKVAGPPRILTVANVTRGKGYADGLEALRGISNLPWEWHLAGSVDWEPDFVSEFRRHVVRLGLEDRVRFHGHLEHSQVRLLYPSSDLFLFPSLTENQPLALLEARAYGIPMVAYGVGGVPDIVNEGPCGLTATPFDVRQLSHKIELLLVDAKLRETLSLAGRENAARQPTWAESAATLILELFGASAGALALV